ncbi:MAG: magnesium transporter [Alphaproteobacteria bacterium]
MAGPTETRSGAWRPRGKAGERAELDHELVRAIQDAIADGDQARVTGLAGPLHEADKADLLEQVTPEERDALVAQWRDEFDEEILPYLHESVRDEIVRLLPRAVLVRAVEELDTDDAIYVIEGLAEGERQELLDALPAPDRAFLEEGLTFEEDSAGRLMQREVVTAPAYWSVGHVIDYLRAAGDELPEEFYDVFVVDPQRRPVGTVPLARLIRTQRPVIVRDIMDPEPHLVRVDTDQEEVAYLFSQYGLTSAAVVDGGGRIVGVITHDDVTEVIEQEAEEDILHLGGVGDTDFRDPVIRTARKRFVWLFFNLGTTLVASFVIGFFHETISQIIALASLMPIVAAIGGNAGTQAMTVAVRALATRDLTSANALRSLRKEVLVALFNGALCAIFMGLITWTRFASWQIAGVMAAAMVANLFMAGLCGGLIPVLLSRWRIDPAPASGVFVTAITDIVGFLAFLGLATLFLL